MYCRRIVVALLLLMLSACASQPEQENLAYFRQQVAQHPQNQIYQMELEHAESLKEQAISREIQELLNLRDYDAAEKVAQVGLKKLPNSLSLREMNHKIEKLVTSKQKYNSAVDALHIHKIHKAINLLKEAVAENPANHEAYDLLKKVNKRVIPRRHSDTIDLNFEKLDLRSAIKFIANDFGVNVIFDDGVKDTPISMSVNTLNFYDAMQVVLQMSHNNYKVVDPKTILIYPDSKPKRAQYQNLILRAVALQYINAKDMAAILKTVLNVRDLSINSANNVLMIRATPQKMGLVEQLITVNDVPAPQVLLDVQILEINKTKAEQLGSNFGSYQAQLQNQPIPLNSSILGSITNNAKLTIPTVALKAYKQKVDAKILANPKIRVLNDHEAKIHIGDRVPLRSSSILDATGQTRTTFEYKDIGIKLTVKPHIHPNNDTSLKVALEVSSLGQNLGTAADPAYQIGTRDAKTTMLLKDGESVLLGGLIREEEHRSYTAIPGISNNPLLSHLFGFDDQSQGRTDVLLTITPRVIRANRENEVIENLDINSGTQQQIYSPTNDQIYRLKVGKPKFSSVKQFKKDKQLTLVDTGDSAVNSNAAVASLQQKQPSDDGNAHQATSSGPASANPVLLPDDQGQPAPKFDASSPTLKVLPALQTVSSGDSVTLKLSLDKLGQGKSLEGSLLFNPNLLRLVSIKPVKPYTTEVQKNQQSDGNTVQFKATVNPKLQKTKEADVVEVTFKALHKGTSFLIVKSPLLDEHGGQKRGVIAHNARITVN